MFTHCLSRNRSRKYRGGRVRPKWVRPVSLELLEDRNLLSGYRSIDGTGNNVANPEWGAAGIHLLRVAPVAYDDGISRPAGADRLSPRAISNGIVAQGSDVLFNDRNMSDWVWQWGQVLDHDLDLTPQPGNPPENFNVPVPAGDPFFDPNNTGTAVIQFDRSVYDPATGTGLDNPRQQPNVDTAFIDASMVYGSDAVRADLLRTHQGGHLKTSPGNLLPFNSAAYFGSAAPLPNANSGPFPNDQLYVAGDVRANENIGLTAVHTLLVREHNRRADQLHREHPRWDDDQLYQEARKIVGAEVEAITYNEFLPALLGPNAPSIRGHYDPSINPGISTEFSTAAFRIGHTLLSPQILRIQNNGQPAPGGPVDLKDSFFNPSLIQRSVDVDYLLKGLASQKAEEVDNKIVDAVRNFLFGPPGAGGFDLASLNIQRGRDHGLCDYNTMRAAFGLPRVTSFAQITSNVTVQNELASLYGNVDDIDAWVGGLAEDHLRGSSVGPLFTAIMVDQFTRLRDCDRFFFENDASFSREQKRELEDTTLAEIIRRNSGIRNIQDNVFFVPGDDSGDDRDSGASSAAGRTAGTLGQAAVLLSSGDHHSAGAFDTGLIAAERAPTPDFLEAVYADALNRSPDAAGMASFGQELSAGASHLAVVSAMLNSDEARQEDVQVMYTRFLHRTADPAGLGAFMSALDAGMSEVMVEAAMIGSTEYSNHG